MVDRNKIFRNAEKYIKSGKIYNAINEYYKLLEENPEDWSTINTIGDLYVRLGKLDEAIKEFNKIVDYYFKEGFYTKAIAILKKISRLAPGRKDTALKLAECYLLQGLPAEAKSIYFDLAENYISKGNLKAAIEIYEKVVELDKENVKLRLNLAKLYSQEKMIEKAVEQFNWVGEALIRSDEIEEAEEILREAQELNPKNLQTINNLLIIYKKKGEDEKAIPILEEALKLEKDNLNFLKHLGTIFYRKNEYSKAEKIFNQVLKISPSEPDIIIKLGKILLSRGEVNKAYDYYKDLIEVFLNAGRVEKAISLLGLILSKDKGHIPSLQKLAEIYRKENNMENLLSPLSRYKKTISRYL